MLQAIHAGWIIPIRPKNKIFRHHTLVLQDSRIVNILPTSEWGVLNGQCESIDCRKELLLPGLVNTQAGASMSLLRGVEATDHRRSWIKKGFLPENVYLEAEHFTRDSSLLAGAEMLLSGTTCFGEVCVLGEEVAASSISLGMRCVLGILITEKPSIWAKNASEYLLKAQNLYDKYRSHPLVKWSFATQMSDISQTGTLDRIQTIGDELDISLRIRIRPNNNYLSKSSSEFEKLKLANLITPKLVVSHVPFLPSSDLQLIQGQGINICHVPSNSIKDENQECAVNIIKNSQCKVGLGTDSTVNNSDYDLFKEMRISSLQHFNSGRPKKLSAFEILELATLGGASVLGLEQEVGSLEPGKSADIISIKINSSTGPVYNVPEQIINRIGRLQINQVWVRGRRVVQNGALSTIESKVLDNKSQAWSESLN